MAEWMISVIVDDQEADISEVREALGVCLRERGVRPRFRTVVAWLVDSTEQLKRLPAPLPVVQVAESEHRGTRQRRRMGAGPAA
jgi:hypothetical protein